MGLEKRLLGSAMLTAIMAPVDKNFLRETLNINSLILPTDRSTSPCSHQRRGFQKTHPTAAPVHVIGTPGMGVIVVGCKSPVRDRKSQGGEYTKWILRSTKYEAKATAGGRPTVGRKPAIVCVSAGSV